MESLTHNYLASDPELEKSTLDSNVENGTELIFFVCFITNQSHAISCSWKRIGKISRNISTELKKVQDQRMQRWSSLFRKRRLKDQVICKKKHIWRKPARKVFPTIQHFERFCNDDFKNRFNVICSGRVQQWHSRIYCNSRGQYFPLIPQHVL